MISNNQVSIIIHTYYRYDYLEKVLQILARQTVKPLEIIISDQTPLDDRPKEFYENFDELPLKIINMDKPSHALAQNIGAKASNGKVLLFLYDGCEFQNDFLKQHIKVMNEENVDQLKNYVSHMSKGLDWSWQSLEITLSSLKEREFQLI